MSSRRGLLRFTRASALTLSSIRSSPSCSTPTQLRSCIPTSGARLLHFSRTSALHSEAKESPGSQEAFALIRKYQGTLSEANVRELQTLKVYEIPAPHQGHIKIWSMNRPKARNALSRQLVADLTSEIESVHAEGPGGQTRTVILASELNEAFCAGADLKERRGMTSEEIAEFLNGVRKSFGRIENLPVPTIASVSGFALGGGLELALCANLRVFSPTAIVGLPETRLAIIPGAGGTYRLPAVVGKSKALRAILTGERLNHVTALEWGLSDYDCTNGPIEKWSDSFAREAALAKSIDVAMKIGEGGPRAIRAAVQALRNGGSVEDEDKAYRSILPTKDRLEALAAFAEKRPAKFTGE